MRNKCGNTKWGASKDKRILEGNLYNKFAVMTSPCDSDSKNQVERSTEFTVLEKNLVTSQPTTIKKLVYIGGTNDINARHNKAMAHMNLINLYPEKFRDIHEFRDQ